MSVSSEMSQNVVFSADDISSFFVEIEDLISEGYSREAAINFVKKRKIEEEAEKTRQRNVENQQITQPEINQVRSLKSLCLMAIKQPKSTHDKLVIFKAMVTNEEEEVNTILPGDEFVAFKSNLVKEVGVLFPAILATYGEEVLKEVLGEHYFALYSQQMEETENARKTLKAFRSGSIIKSKENGLTEAEQELAKTHGIYPYRVLKAGVKWPEGIDATKRETYLSEQEFYDVMEISKESYLKMFKYKRIQLKKDKGLF